jgi:hypothetical protein
MCLVENPSTGGGTWINGSDSDLAAAFPSPVPLWLFHDKGGEEMD